LPSLKESATHGEHSFTINSPTQSRPSTFDPSNLRTFHNLKGHSTEECRVVLRNKNEEEENGIDSENSKTAFNNRIRETKEESPSSPPPATKKRVYMIL
ncbi:hypothetical protein N665_0553s0009, partial [Sinapis alba]